MRSFRVVVFSWNDKKGEESDALDEETKTACRPVKVDEGLLCCYENVPPSVVHGDKTHDFLMDAVLTSNCLQSSCCSTDCSRRTQTH